MLWGAQRLVINFQNEIFVTVCSLSVILTLTHLYLGPKMTPFVRNADRHRKSINEEYISKFENFDGFGNFLLSFILTLKNEKKIVLYKI